MNLGEPFPLALAAALAVLSSVAAVSAMAVPALCGWYLSSDAAVSVVVVPALCGWVLATSVDTHFKQVWDVGSPVTPPPLPRLWSLKHRERICSPRRMGGGTKLVEGLVVRRIHKDEPRMSP